jgi:hypothetical protein
MSGQARANGWRGFDGIGEKVDRVIGVKDSKSGWLYRCDGMPRLSGCGAEAVVSRRFARPGTKSTGWLVTYGKSFPDEKGDDEHGNDLDVVLTFCPECAATVRAQDALSPSVPIAVKVMDLDPAAVEAAIESAAKTEYEYREGLNAALPPRTNVKTWPPATIALTTAYRDEAERAILAAYPIIADSVARATADAIADKIEAIHHEGMPARNHAMKLAANIARSHGQAQTTEDGQ